MDGNSGRKEVRLGYLASRLVRVGLPYPLGLPYLSEAVEFSDPLASSIPPVSSDPPADSNPLANIEWATLGNVEALVLKCHRLVPKIGIRVVLKCIETS